MLLLLNSLEFDFHSRRTNRRKTYQQRLHWAVKNLKDKMEK